jgi:hypothetical protein
MKDIFFSVAMVALAATLLSAVSARPSFAVSDTPVSYPDGYREWRFLHSSLAPPNFPGFSKMPCLKPCTNGIFYFYGNDLAVAGFKTGNFPDGAVIAEEMLEYLVNEKGVGKEGKRVLTAVMFKDSVRYAATGGWGFGNFDEGSKTNTLDAKAQQNCFQCHTSRKDHGFVFTEYSPR